MIDRIVNVLYWPTLALSVAIILIAPFAALTGLISPRLIIAMAMVVGGFAALPFMIATLDGKTLSGVILFTRATREHRRSQTWLERLFPARWDRRLVVSNRVLFVELVMLMFTPLKEIQLLIFSGFFLSVVMLMLKMRQGPDHPIDAEPVKPHPHKAHQ